MSFRYRAALLHWLSSAGSINSLVWVRAWVTRMTCFACPESCFFFSQSLSSDLIYEWVQMHLIILRGRNPCHPIRIHLFVCKKSSSTHSKKASRHLLPKEYALKLVNRPRRASTVTLWLSNRPSRYDLICLSWSFLTRRVKYSFKRRACQVYRVG